MEDINYIKQIIEKQLLDNFELNLFFKDLEEELTINTEFKNLFLKIKKKDSIDINNLMDYTLKSALKNFYKINQYINVTENDKEALKNIYKKTFNTIDEKNYKAVLINHLKELSVWLSKFYPDSFVTSLSNSKKIGSVINEEYTCDLQEALFKIDYNKLKEPILDIGCGLNANLVKKLICLNKNAFGIDRITNGDFDFIKEISWFDFEYKKNYWGTIFANMSFTNHLLYTMNNDKSNIYDYFVLYKKIINSLKNGGRFLYAPSVQFIEERLDCNKYIIENETVSGIMITILKKNN